MTGRTSTYSDEVADQILERITDGEGLRAICKGEGMPALRTVFNWLRGNPEFDDAYNRAVAVRAEHLFEEMLEIADGEEVGSDAVQRDRLRVDTRKWALAKMQPKRFADRMAVDSTSDVTIRQSQQLDLSHLTQAERDTMRALLMKGETPAPAKLPDPGSRH